MKAANYITFAVAILCSLQLYGGPRTITLSEAIELAKVQSVDAAVAINELRAAYWEYHTFKADMLPEVNFSASLPSYNQNYTTYQQADGSYTYVRNNYLGMNGEISVNQNIPLQAAQFHCRPPWIILNSWIQTRVAGLCPSPLQSPGASLFLQPTA